MALMDARGDIDENAVKEALAQQARDPDEHDRGLIDECLRLTPEERIQRLTAWVGFLATAKPIP